MPSLSLVQKSMLKGLKKIQPAQQEPVMNTEKPKVNESSIKRQQVMEDEGEVEGDPQKMLDSHLASERKKQYELCFQLFLNGKTQEVTELIEKLKKEEEQEQKISLPETRIPKQRKGKFDYDLNFEQQEQDIKRGNRKRNRPIMKSNRIQQYCIFCPDNEELQLLSASNYVYLALPKHKTFKNYPHFILAPVDHEQTTIGLNEDTLTEISNYKKCLIQAFDKINMQMVFFQQFSKQNSHIYIECLAMSMEKAQDLPFFFKQALEGIEGNWNTHKNIIKIEKEKGGLQKQIPKQIKYFYIDFSLGYGYAHVIENDKFWKRDFCYEVIATALGMESHRVKTTQEFSEEQLAVKKQTFSKIWKAFDWTQLI